MNRLYLLVALAVFWMPVPSHAQVPFGGLEVLEFPCTCSPFMYVAFAPLYIASVVPVTGSMADEYTHIFAHFVPHVGAWQLGYFTPGVQACWMYVGTGCAPLAVLGTILPATGSSI